MEILTAWLQFAICLSLIAIAGPALTRSGSAISRHTGMSASWVGLIMLAAATSVPELFTGISAVTFAKAPNIAMGDALGSCVFNLVMLVLLDALCREEPVWRRSDQGHILSAGFGVILTSFVGLLILTSRNGLDYQIGHVSIFSPFLLLLYIVAMRAAFFYERRPDRKATGKAGPEGAELPLKDALVRYAIAALIVGATGAWLPFVGQDVAHVMGWRASFVGTLFIAAATSLPELIVTVSALRMGSPDMAIGNLLGSNLFVILIIALDDMAYRDGSLYALVSPAHAVTAFAAAMMAGLCIVGLLYRPGNRFFGFVGWISLSLLAIYLLSSYSIYLHGY
jgi:cation:H+ antiporter